MKITKKRYKYIISTPLNYTCTNLAAHLEQISHDAVNDYLWREKQTSHTLWELAQPLINNSKESFFVLDDSVQDKSYSQKIERVKLQSSGNTHSLVKGIGVVNLVHVYEGDYHPFDFRVYAPAADGKKNDPFQDILRQAFEEKGLQAQTILFDSGYAGMENLNFIHGLGKFL